MVLRFRLWTYEEHSRKTGPKIKHFPSTQLPCLPASHVGTAALGCPAEQSSAAPAMQYATGRIKSKSFERVCRIVGVIAIFRQLRTQGFCRAQVNESSGQVTRKRRRKSRELRGYPRVPGYRGWRRTGACGRQRHARLRVTAHQVSESTVAVETAVLFEGFPSCEAGRPTRNEREGTAGSSRLCPSSRLLAIVSVSVCFSPRLFLPRIARLGIPAAPGVRGIHWCWWYRTEARTTVRHSPDRGPGRKTPVRR